MGLGIVGVGYGVKSGFGFGNLRLETWGVGWGFWGVGLGFWGLGFMDVGFSFSGLVYAGVWG